MKDELPPVECAECGQPLVPLRSDTRYCSPLCRVRAHRRRRRQSRSVI